MKVVSLLFVVLSFWSQLATADEGATLPDYSIKYDDKRDPFVDAKAAIALAQNTNRQVLIKIGGNWCGWCKKMDAFINDNPDVYKNLHDNYVVLKINVSDSNENEAFMKSLPPTLGYPHIYVSTNNGKMLKSKDTAELLTNNNYNRNQWLTFLAKWQLSNNDINLAKNRG